MGWFSAPGYWLGRLVLERGVAAIYLIAFVAALVVLTGRAQPNVSRSLQTLAKLGLVRLVREGREVRPVPVAKGVRVDLTTGTYEITSNAR